MKTNNPKTKHTPAPWHVSKHMNEITIQSTMGYYGFGSQYSIARVDTEADAALIAAAPEMLRECVEILELLETKNLTSKSKTLDSTIMHNLRDLVKKARGES
ncbi:MAG: hypothetical protein KDA17_00615 [Candidatus Saccharibacteria bacterium]|nr:hypothetical protein [Candidatus Saccharibacteria bacterium]